MVGKIIGSSTDLLDHFHQYHTSPFSKDDDGSTIFISVCDRRFLFNRIGRPDNFSPICGAAEEDRIWNNCFMCRIVRQFHTAQLLHMHNNTL